MLKWKRIKVTAATVTEEVVDALAGMAGKNRVIKYLAETEHTEDIRLRVYRDAEQIVDFDCNLLTAQFPLLPMDLSLAEGQLCKIGLYNGTSTSRSLKISIGYTEAD